MNSISKLILYLFLVLNAGSLFSQSIFYSDDQKKIKLDPYIYYYEDESGEKEITAIIKKENIELKKADFDSINFGFTNSTYWISFSVYNNTPSQVFLQLDNPLLNYFELYTVRKDGSIKKHQGGLQSPDQSGNKYNIFFAIPLEEEEAEYYLKLTGTYPLRTSLHLMTQDRIVQEQHFLDIEQGVYVGFMVLICFYNFFIFMKLKESVYLYYIAFIISSGFTFIFLKGYGSDLVWRNNLWLIKHALLFPNLCGILAIIFTIKFLKLEKYFPVVRKNFMIPIILFLSSSLLNLLDYDMMSVIILQAASVMAGLLLFIAGITLYRRGHTEARYFVFAWTMLIFGLIIYIARDLQILPTNYFTQNGMQLGFAAQMALLTIALADKISIYKSERESAYKDLVVSLKENERLILQQKKTLEEEVEKRTKELTRSLNRIEKDVELASKLQKNLLPSKLISFDDYEIYSVYKPLMELGGDYYDVEEVSENILRVFLADVTGHGIQAALLTMIVKSEYENYKYMPYPSSILKLLNTSIINRYPNSKIYFTCFIADINLSTGTIKYASAGHLYQYILRNSEIIELAPTGKLMGGFKNIEFEQFEITLNKSDRILFLTDGLLEQFNKEGEPWGEEGLKNSIQSHLNRYGKDFVDSILADLETYLIDSDYQDDISVLLFEKKRI